MFFVKHAYSYIRFSRLHQQQGDSLRRQLRSIEDYRHKNNPTLDDSLIFRDLGISAFRGRKKDKGAFPDEQRAELHTVSRSIGNVRGF